MSAVIYAGAKNEKLAHICDTILSRKVGKGNEAAVASGKYVPNDMQSASAYFQKGLYENHVLGSVATNGGSLKVGLKSTSMPTSYWAIFDNFRLYYYGSKTAEEVTTGIDASLMNREERIVNSAVYDLQGRVVKNPTKGLYIVNGKKVVIK